MTEKEADAIDYELERIRWDYPDKDEYISRMSNRIDLGASTTYFVQYEVGTHMAFDYS